MVLGLEQAKVLLYCLRQSVPNLEEMKSFMELLMNSQSAKGVNMLMRALKSEETIKVGEPTLIKIPQNVLEYLPESFKAEVLF